MQDGSNSTATAVELSREVSKSRSRRTLVVTPYYNKAAQKGLIEHYKAIAREADAPIIMYSVASRTGCNIEPAMVGVIKKEVDNIVGVKEASGNISQVAKIMQLTQGDIDLYSGNDDQIVPILALGRKGGYLCIINVAPREMHEICAKFFAGDIAGSRELQLKQFQGSMHCSVNLTRSLLRSAVSLMEWKAWTADAADRWKKQMHRNWHRQ